MFVANQVKFNALFVVGGNGLILLGIGGVELHINFIWIFEKHSQLAMEKGWRIVAFFDFMLKGKRASAILLTIISLYWR